MGVSHGMTYIFHHHYFQVFQPKGHTAMTFQLKLQIKAWEKCETETTTKRINGLLILQKRWKADKTQWRARTCVCSENMVLTTRCTLRWEAYKTAGLIYLLREARKTTLQQNEWDWMMMSSTSLPTHLLLDWLNKFRQQPDWSQGRSLEALLLYICW